MPNSARKRIFIVTNEILGVVRTGGSGTANTFLSFALARAGHEVELLITAPSGAVELDPRWAAQYAERGIGVRMLDEPGTDVVPGALALALTVEEVLERDPPDIVIADAWSAPAYMALRLRDLDLGFQKTTFIVVCHGPTAWAYETDRKLPRSFPAFELEAIERTSVELADAVVSPSRHLLNWLEDRGWRLPRSFVVPHFTQSGVDAQTVPKAAFATRLQRIAFFGRLEERKGLTPFVAAVNGLEQGALTGIELAFVGRDTPQWPVQKVEESLSDSVKAEVAALRFENDLDQPEAIALLKEAGTVAVMPSLLENSPNVVYECLEHGIPFLASRVGGVPELIVEEDHERALVEPTAEGIRAGLERLLGPPQDIPPIRPSFDHEQILASWQEAIGSAPTSRAGTRERAYEQVSAVVVQRHEPDELRRCLKALAAQTRPPDQVVVVAGDHEVALGAETWPWPLSVVAPTARTPSALREAGIRASAGDFVLLLDGRDELDRDCLETLAHAQASSAADVVTCAMRHNGKLCFFLGEPNELGLVGNYYGLIALCRRSLLETSERPPDTRGDTDWVLFATLSRAGAKIVAVPRPLASSGREPGNALTDPIGSGAALAVVREFERACPPELRELPRLAASLAARRTASIAPASIARRLRWIWEHEGAAGVARRGIEASRLLRKPASPGTRL